MLKRSLSLLPILALVLIGCSDSLSQKNSTTVQSSPESSYCSGTLTVTGGSTNITANATFNRYDDGAGGLTSSTNKIRYAEVRILNSAGTVIQCGETDSNGDIGSTSDFFAGVHATPGPSLFLAPPRQRTTQLKLFHEPTTLMSKQAS